MTTVHFINGPFAGCEVQLPDAIVTINIAFFGDYDSSKSDQHRPHRLAHYQRNPNTNNFLYIPQHQSNEDHSSLPQLPS